MQVSGKTALIIYFVVTPILAISGMMNNILLMFYFSILGLISITMTIFGDD